MAEAVEKGLVPRGQYGAVLVDEGHDFEPEWLKLAVSMAEPAASSVLVLFDDAQSIYAKDHKRKFSFKSAGIQAAGRMGRGGEMKEEETRLLYVAMTRATEELVVCEGGGADGYAKA